MAFLTATYGFFFPWEKSFVKKNWSRWVSKISKIIAVIQVEI
jgi:hypothetical protein